MDTFANTLRVGNSVNDFTLVFGTIDDYGPGNLQHSDRVSVHLSPQMLKIVAQQLSANVEAYELAFGTIKLPKAVESSFDSIREQLTRMFAQQASG